MAKINASTGQVIKKDGSDIHVPREIQQVQSDQLEEAGVHDEFVKNIDRDFIKVSEDWTDGDSEKVNPDSGNDTAREEELQLIDEDSAD